MTVARLIVQDSCGIEGQLHLGELVLHQHAFWINQVIDHTEMIEIRWNQ
jgi:hypothetical protein